MANITPDLNLLRILHVIGEEKNLSRAAEHLQLSQPGLSHALKRLREEFGDPLFVRASRGLVPTPRLESLLPEIRALIVAIDRIYAPDVTKDFLTLRKRFVLGATTYFELRVLGTLLGKLRSEAPGVTLETHSLTQGFPRAELEDGRMDLAVAAYFEELPESFRARSLGSDPHVCVMRKRHPLREALNLKNYLAATHVKIAVPPGKLSAVDRVLAESGKQRHIVAHLSNFITPATVLRKSNHLLTCPQSLAESYAEHLGLHWRALPLAVPGVEVKMVWHERLHKDLFQKWIRGVIVDAANSGSRPLHQKA